MTIGIYAKAVAGAAVAGLTATITALEDGTINGYEWTVIAGATAVAVGAVWAVPNTPEGVRRYGKAITAGVVAVLGSVGAAVVDGSGIGPDEWVAIVVALVGGLALTYTTPNADWSDGMGHPVPVGPGEYSDLDRRDGLGREEPPGATPV